MKINLVFDTWRRKGIDIHGTMEYVELSLGLFHSGTTFQGEIVLDDEDAAELQDALDNGYQAVFWVSKSNKED